MSTTYSQFLKLRLSSELTPDALYNLKRIDSLASTFITDRSSALLLRSITDITIEPESAEVGGSGAGGKVNIGTAGHSVDEINLYGAAVNVGANLNLNDTAAGGTKRLGLKYKSDASGAADIAADRSVTIDVDGANRSVVLGGNLQLGGALTTGGAVTAVGANPLTLRTSDVTDVTLPTTGTLATLDGTETLTGKTISGSANTITGLTDSAIDAAAAIAYSKLNLTGSVVNADVAGGAAIAGTKISPDFGSQNITTAGSLRLKTGANTASLQPPTSLSSDIGWKLPSAIGGTGQVLQLLDDTTGELGWASVTTSVLSEHSLRVGDAGSAAIAVDTSAVGDVLADAAGGLTYKAGSITNTDVSAAAAIAYSKLQLTASIMDADINSAAAIAYSKLNLTSSIVNADVAAGAAIAYSKLAVLTASRAAATDASGFLTTSAATSAELDHLAGVTSAVQGQLDARLLKGGDIMTGALTLSGDPSSSLHAATKQYVDALVNGVKWKASVRAASTSNVDLATGVADGSILDDVTLAAGDRILLGQQTDASENGLYVVAASGAPTRAADANSAAELNGAVVLVQEGTTNANKGFQQTTELTDFSGQVWVQNFGTGLYTADGQGLSLSGSTFSLALDGTTLSKSGSGLRVAAGGITNAEIGAAAAIAYSKLALGDSLLVADVASAAKSGSGTKLLTDAAPSITDFLDLAEVASPTAPSAGGLRVYAKSGKVYKQNSSGVEQELGAGGGQGELNLNTNPSAATDVGDVTASGTATVTRVATGGPLDPAIPTAFRLDAGAADDYIEIPFTVPDALAGVKLKVEWFQEPEAGAASGEWKVEVHDGSSEYPLTSDADGDTAIPAATGKFTTTFTTGAAGTGYKVRFVRVSGSNHLDVTSVIVGPGIQPQGAAVGAVSFTPTVNNFGTVSGTFWEAQRVGEYLVVDGRFLGGTAVASPASLSLPTGMTINPEKLSSSGEGIGTWENLAVSSTYLYTSPVAGKLFYDGSDTAKLYFAINTASNVYAKANASAIPGGQHNVLRFRIPIAEWAGSGTVNLIDNFTSVDTRKLTLTNLGSAGTPSNLGEYRAYYGTSGWVYGTDIASTSVGRSSGSNGSCFRIDYVGVTDGSVAHRIDLFIGKNMPSYKIHGFSDDDLTTEVRIDPVKYNSTTAYGLTSFYNPDTGVLTVSLQPQDDGSVTEVRPALSASGGIGHTTAYFYVTTSSMAVPGVGFAEVQPGVASGLVSATGLKGRTDGAVVPASYVGQEKKQTRVRSSGTSLTSATSANVTASALSLEAGVWEVSGVVGFHPSAGTGVSGLDAAISTTSATSPGSDTIGVADASGQIRNNSNIKLAVDNADIQLPVGPVRVSISSTTSYYLVGNATFASGTTVAYGTIRAVRVA